MTESTPNTSKVPKEFGKYELLRRIGAGGMAEVFLARSFGAEGLEKTLVIKRILPAYARKQRFVSMFIDEAKLAVSLNHPNIVQTYDFGRVGDDYFLAMEYVEGTDLARLLARLRRIGKFPLGDAIFLAIELCKGLDYAHRRADKFGEALGLVHRDISPQNLLISRDGDLKIVDFGIAHARNITSEPAGLIKGKYSYMSPEQASGMAVDGRSDIFSVAVVLFELVYGRPLFRYTTSEETLDLVKRAVVPDLAAIDSNVPDSVERILYKALQRGPAKRYQSARELQVDLHKVLFELGEIHDATTVAEFVIKVLGSAPGEEADHVQTVVHAAGSKTPSIVLGAASSTSVIAPMSGDMTPATPGLMSADPSSITAVRQARKDVICVSGHVTGFDELRASGMGRHAHGLLMELMRIVEAIAFKNRAIVEHFADNRFLLLLGLPVSAENDAERAVLMCLDLLEAVAGINLNLETPVQISLGVALGKALVQRDENGDFKRQLLGRVTQLAALIALDAMPREILVGGRVYQRIRRGFEASYLKQIQFEDSEAGQIASPSVYRVLRPKTRRERQADLRDSFDVLHGRDLPMKSLRERFERTLVESTCLGLVISGPTGLGKSALVDEFVRGIETRWRFETTGVEEDTWQPASRVIRTEPGHHAGETPYATLRQIVQDLLKILSDDDIRAIKTRIEDSVADLFADVSTIERDYLIHSLGFFFGVRYQGSSLESLGGHRRRARVFLSVQRLVERKTLETPLIIVVEDLQTCDASSLEMLADLVEEAGKHSLFFVLTMRPTAMTNPVVERLVNHSRMQVEELNELSRRHATELVRSRLGEVDIDRVALDYILDRAGGVPFFINELVDALRARSILKLVNGRYTLGGSAHETWLPTSLEAVVAARIDQLDGELKTTLLGVAVLGAEFERRDAVFLLGPEVAPQLSKLVELGWLRRQGSRGETARRYRFAHTINYEVAFRELVWEDRAEKHARLADHLMAEIKEGRRQPDLAAVARHLEGAGRHEEAANYYVLAATRALGASSHVEALRMVNRALEVARPGSRIIYDCLTLKESVLSALSHHEERLETLEAMRQMAVERFGKDEELAVLNRLASYWIDQRAFDDAQKYIDLAIEHSDPDAHLGHVSWAKMLAATVMRESGNAARAIDVYAEAMMGFNAVDDRHMAARTTKNIADTYWQMGCFDEALEAYENALGQIDGDEGRDLAEVVAVNMALVHVSLGDYELALERYRQALRSCRAIGFQRREVAILPNLGHLYVLLGEGTRAERTLHRAVRLARRIRDNMVLCDAILTLGVVQLERQKFDRAEEALRRGRRLAIETEINYLIIHADLALARLWIERSHGVEHVDEILKHGREAIKRGHAASMVHGIAHGETLIARAYCLAGRSAEAAQAADRALAALATRPVQLSETLEFDLGVLLPQIAPARAEEGRVLVRSAAATLDSIAERLSDEERRAKFLARPQVVKIRATRDALDGE